LAIIVDNNVDIMADIHLLGEHLAVRESLARLCASLRLRLRCWPTLPALIAGVDVRAIGVLVLDVDALDAVRAASLDLPAIVLARRPTVAECRRAFKAGAVEFLPMPVAAPALAAALRTALSVHVHRSAQTQATRQCRERFASLSAREREVLDMLAEGLTNREIATALAISTRTVEKHRANLFDKLDAPSLAPLVRRYAALLVNE
jgi:two-component system response regulator FixJ